MEFNDDDMERMKYLRENQSVGFYEARDIVRKEKLLAMLKKASNLDDLKLIIQELLR